MSASATPLPDRVIIPLLVVAFRSLVPVTAALTSVALASPITAPSFAISILSVAFAVLKSVIVSVTAVTAAVEAFSSKLNVSLPAPPVRLSAPALP